MAETGKINHLTILEKTAKGLCLDDGILLPKRHVTNEMEIGQTLEVFIYPDSEDRLVATTEIPLVQVGECAQLVVAGLHERAGAFLRWGLGKDLLLPYREQGDLSLKEGDRVIVAVYIDEHTNRIVASARLRRHLTRTNPDYQPNDPVQVLIYEDSPLGSKAIVDKIHQGLFYHSETADTLHIGDEFTGYVQKVHPNGKIDLRRDPAGYTRVGPVVETIRQKLDAAGGVLPYNTKSTSESIRQNFGTSKKAFKQALGALYKQRHIRFTETGIEKVDPDQTSSTHKKI